MNFYFSPSKPSIYSAALYDVYCSAGTWPDDAVEITEEIAAAYHPTRQPSGKILGVGPNELPAWVEMPQPPEPTHAELVAAAEIKKKQLIDNAMQSISLIQLKLQAGRELLDGEARRLNLVIDYIDAVQAIDTFAAPGIKWPTLPIR
jgi:hypothetical protein